MVKSTKYTRYSSIFHRSCLSREGGGGTGGSGTITVGRTGYRGTLSFDPFLKLGCHTPQHQRAFVLHRMVKGDQSAFQSWNHPSYVYPYRELDFQKHIPIVLAWLTTSSLKYRPRGVPLVSHAAYSKRLFLTRYWNGFINPPFEHHVILPRRSAKFSPLYIEPVQR